MKRWNYFTFLATGSLRNDALRRGRPHARPVSQFVHAPRARPRCLLLLPNAALARARDTTMIFMLNNLSTTPTGHLVEDVASRLAADLLIYLNLLF